MDNIKKKEIVFVDPLKHIFFASFLEKPGHVHCFRKFEPENNKIIMLMLRTGMGIKELGDRSNINNKTQYFSTVKVFISYIN